jgi:hypothetical protein
MSAQLSMFGLPILPDTRSAISSPESADGPTPCASPVGPTTGPSGPDPARVSRFRARDSERAMPTNDTSGPLFTTSSPSANLQRSLESKLRTRMAASGTLLYRLTWKQWDMPAGPPICALRASDWSGKKHRQHNGWTGPFCIVQIPTSPPRCVILPIGLAEKLSRALQTSASACIGWPTPQARDHFPAHSPEYVAAKKAQGHGMANLNDVTQLAGWPTPQAQDSSGGGQAKRAMGPDRHGSNLNDFAMLAGWPTPTVGNATGSQAAKDSSPTGKRPDGTKATVSLNAVAKLTGWSTPTARDGTRGSLPPRPTDTGVPLDQMAALSGWPTPQARDWKSSASSPETMDSNSRPLNEQARQLAGWPTCRANDGSGAQIPPGRQGGVALKTAALWAVGPARVTADGEMLTGSSAQMRSGGQLHPAHSLWLQGYPIVWPCYAGLATPSTRPSPRSSSKHSPKS